MNNSYLVEHWGKGIGLDAFGSFTQQNTYDESGTGEETWIRDACTESTDSWFEGTYCGTAEWANRDSSLHLTNVPEGYAADALA